MSIGRWPRTLWGLVALVVLGTAPLPATAMSRRPVGNRAVVYETGGVHAASISRSAGNGAIVIEVHRSTSNRDSAAQRPKRLADPAQVLEKAIAGAYPIQTQSRLAEEVYRRLGVVLPSTFTEQSLFGRLVATGQERTGDLLYFAGPDGRTAARVAIFLAPNRLVYLSEKTGKVQTASRSQPPWAGPQPTLPPRGRAGVDAGSEPAGTPALQPSRCAQAGRLLFTRRILGTVFEDFVSSSTGRTAGRSPLTPAPLREHYQTELEGIASLYGHGDGSHGRSTANGETYNEEALTAAHRTLPFNAWVLVTNLDNGRRVIVRINDRGPFAQKERVIDLSYRAARLLGMDAKGTAKVRLSVIRVAHENDV